MMAWETDINYAISQNTRMLERPIMGGAHLTESSCPKEK